MKVFVKTMFGIVKNCNENGETEDTLELAEGSTVNDLLDIIGVKENLTPVVTIDGMNRELKTVIHDNDNVIVMPIPLGG